jgi:hypothetical protein
MAKRTSVWTTVDGVTIGATALAILAVTPNGWLDNLGAWTELLADAQPLLGLAALVLVGSQTVVVRRRLERVRHRRRPDRELLSTDGLGIYRLLEAVQPILERTGQAKDVSEHRVRVAMLTGRAMVDPLFDILTSQRPPGRWRVEILVVSPTSPIVAQLEHRTRHDVEASLCRLAELRSIARREGWTYDIEYRTYDAAPTMRGFLVDGAHLFLGYTAWVDDVLTTQGHSLLHVEAGTPAADLEVQWFRSWFDHTFAAAGRPGTPGGDKAA